MSEASGLCRPEPLMSPAPPHHSMTRSVSALGEMIGCKLRCGSGAATGASAALRRSPFERLVQRTGATTIDPRWQVWRATFRHTA